LENYAGTPALHWFERLDNRITPRRMLNKATVLTHPAPARQDAPFRKQGRSE
jgi:hypothetical protein